MAFSKNFKPVPYRRNEIEDLQASREQEQAQFEQERNEQAAREARYTVIWTANSGAKIAVRYIAEIEEYEVTVNNGLPKRAFEIVPVTNIPGVVAKIGNVGLTAERKAAIVGLTK